MGAIRTRLLNNGYAAVAGGRERGQALSSNGDLRPGGLDPEYLLSGAPPSGEDGLPVLPNIESIERRR